MNTQRRSAFVFSALVLTLLMFAPATARAQVTTPPDGTQITSAQVSGVELSRLSPGLRDDIGKLTGTPLDRQQLRALAERLEGEQPRYVAAVRITADPAGGARVVFVVARMKDPEQQANINEKYLVEDVIVRGVADSAVSAEIRAALDALKGKPLDSDQAERIEIQLRAAFPQYDVSRSTKRGDQPGHIDVVFHLGRKESTRWLRFDPLNANGTYHSDQGWGANLAIGMGSKDFRFTPFIPIDTTDDLVEEYSGFGMRFESRKLGTERLGLNIEGSWLDMNWRPSTLAAIALDPSLPFPYEDRATFTPVLKFAVTRGLTVGGGVGISELETLESFSGFRGTSMANVAIGSVGYNFQKKSDPGGRHYLDAGLTFRAGLDELESDYVYNRSRAHADYSYRSGKHRVLVSGLAGFIDGNAPLFERFTLGDVRTLRGWDKYEIAPAGGDRMYHGSLEYRFSVVQLFVDVGSVWNDGTERKLRASTGIGVVAGPVFMTVGIPLNTSDLRAVFMMGFRFGSFGFQK